MIIFKVVQVNLGTRGKYFMKIFLASFKEYILPGQGIEHIVYKSILHDSVFNTLEYFLVGLFKKQ